MLQGKRDRVKPQAMKPPRQQHAKDNLISKTDEFFAPVVI